MASLLLLRAIGEDYREQLWIATQAALPVHHGTANKLVSGSAGQQATSTDVSMKGWKTYKNDEYGFEYEYPAAADENDMYGTILLNVENIKFDQKNISTEIQPTSKVVNIQHQSINSVAWYSFLLADFPECSDRFFQTGFQNKTIEIRFARCNQGFDTFLKKHPEVMDQVIQTFKFTK